MTDHAGWVVVGLVDDCPEHEGHDCVSWVQGPFESHDDAVRLAEYVPQGFRPHILTLGKPMITDDAIAVVEPGKGVWRYEP